MKKSKNQKNNILNKNITLITSIILSTIFSLSVYHFFNISKYFIFIFIILFQQIILNLFNNYKNCFKKINFKKLILSLIFSILIIISFSGFIFFKPQKLTIIPLNNNNSSYNGEIWICNLTIGNKGLQLYQENLNQGWQTNGNCLIHNGNDYNYEILNVQSNEILKFDLLKSKFSGNVAFQYGSEYKEYDLNSNVEEYININFKGIDDYNLNIQNIFYIVSLFLTITSIMYISLSIFKTNKYILLIPLSIIYSTISYNLSFNKYILVIQFLFLIFSYFYTLKYFDTIKEYFTKFKLILLAFVTFLTTFLIYGEQLFLCFKDIAFYYSLENVMLFVLCFILTLVYTLFILCFFDNLNKLILKKNKNKNKIFIYFLISFICTSIWMLAFYPGNYSSDSISQIEQALIGPISDAHPAIMTLIIKMLFNIFQTPFSYIVFQCLFFSLTIAIIENYLYKKGYSNLFLIIISIIMSMLPCVGMLNVTLWKDTIYTSSILLLSFYTYIIVINDYKSLYRLPNIILFVISFVFVKEFRHNGLIPFAFCSLLFIIISFRRKDIKLGVITIISIFLSTFGIQLIYNANNVQHTNMNGSIYNSVVKNWGAILYYGGNLSTEENQKLNLINDNNFFIKNYYPNNIDYYFYANSESASKWLNGVNNYKAKEIIPLYLKTINKYPGVFIRDRFDSMDIMIDSSFKSYKYYVFPYSVGVQNLNSNTEKKAFQNIEFINNKDYTNNNFISQKIILPFMNYTLMSNLFALLIWKTGLYFVLYIILIYYLILKRKAINILGLTPIIGNTLSWLLVLNHPSVRYVYYLNISFVFMLCLVIIDSKIKKEEKNG
jgi:hypothetical protein